MIGGNYSSPWITNPFLLKENEKFFIFTKMILQVILKLLPILILLGASVVTFSTQKIFRSWKCIKYVFKTFLWNYSFAPRSFGVSQMILLFLCSRTKSKSVIFMPVSDDFKTCPYVEFCSNFWVQGLLKIFLCLKSIHIRYLKGLSG